MRYKRTFFVAFVVLVIGLGFYLYSTSHINLKMDLAEWQIVLLSTAVGSAVPLILVALREIYQERKLGRQIRNILIGELSLIQETLNEALSKGIRDEKDTETVRIEADTSLYNSFPLDTAYYDDLDIATLGKYLNINTLKLLQKLYRMIYDYNQSYMVFIGANRVEIKPTKELLQKIDQAIKAMNT
jgi:hypothetical protein